MTIKQLLEDINHSQDIQTFAQDNLLKCTESSDGRFILNYDEKEYNTPKNRISHYCRGLVLAGEPHNYIIIAKSFDRFYNLGEVPEYLNGGEQIDWNKPFQVEYKEDGSLILLYYWNGAWRVNTRGSFAQGKVSSVCNLTWEELFWEGVFNVTGSKEKIPPFPIIEEERTYIFELCSPYNQVVEYYPETKITCLGSMITFPAVLDYEDREWYYKEGPKVPFPTQYQCHSKEEVFQLLETLPPTSEGFVIKQWNEEELRFIRRKCKTKTWAILAHIKETKITTEKKLWEIVFSGDADEVISVFPHLKENLAKKKEQYQSLMQEIQTCYDKYKVIENQKDFAELIKGMPFRHALFALRSGYNTLPEVTRKFIIKKYEPKNIFSRRCCER